MGKGLVVVSLFDGISCGQIALKELGIKVDKLYASEIDTHAIKLTQHNFPETIQLGDVRSLSMQDLLDLGEVDLLIGGSPCQGFSINGKMLDFKDERSRLLFEFIRVRDILKPKHWMLENVATMKQPIKQAIDSFVGVEGQFVNSRAFSAQNRKRYYWTNIPFVAKTETSPLLIKDIMEYDLPSYKLMSEDILKYQKMDKPTETDGVITLNPKKFDGKQSSQHKRIYDYRGRMVALTATLTDRFYIKDEKDRVRKLTIREQARLQTIPDWYDFSPVSTLQASKGIGNGWTVAAVAHILKGIRQ